MILDALVGALVGAAVAIWLDLRSKWVADGPMMDAFHQRQDELERRRDAARLAGRW